MVEQLRTVGVEHQVHFALASETALAMRVRTIKYVHASKTADASSEPCLLPWGTTVHVNIEDTGPSVDFELRRIKLPSDVSLYERARVRLHSFLLSIDRLQNIMMMTMMLVRSATLTSISAPVVTALILSTQCTEKKFSMGD